ncbi:MAG: Stk1 family PASTA domain-containing Ser/Thr kinase [Oscillospiraceae bacterium]|nr:Stk1 family PASTA domain-containing Ser/Thr kinase [Oscillospiraceae bacterium]
MDKYLGTVLDGRYELLEIIGTGGMAMVYKARDNRLNRLVAVKILKEDLALDADFRRRFQTESQAVAMLSSPNIVAVYDVSKSLETEYIVMELIEGITLKQYMNRKGKLNWKESLHFATQITKALSHAHSRGIIHRDIKPHNIMILKDGSVKVADFGIARLLDDQNATMTQEALGSVHYISPEQAKGGQVDARSDLYSVGVVLYEMLTSRLPFDGDNAVSVAIQHISSIPLSPREINPEIPAGLEAITMKAMNPDLNLRYQTADDLLRDFEEFRKNPNIVFPFGAAFGIGAMAGAVGGAAASAAARPGVAPTATGRPPGRPASNVANLDDDEDRGRKKRPLTKEEERDRRHNRNRKSRKVSTMLGVGGVVVALIAIFIFLWQLILGNLFAPAPERVEVDDFVGRQVERVYTDRDYLEIYEFTIQHEPTDEAVEGTILRQNPSAGRTVAPNDDGLVPVTLFVAAPSDNIEMPSLANLSYEAARTRLMELGVSAANIMRREEASDQIMENHVISTIPEAGRAIPEDGPVVLFVSTGPVEQLSRVPDMVGSTLTIAVDRLRQENLVVREEWEYNAAANGTVIRQSHPAGTEVPERTEITLTVSRGPEPTPTPTPTPPPPTPTPTPPPNGYENGPEFPTLPEE